MNVQIVEKQTHVVRVDSEIGCFTGMWCSCAPAELKGYTVELDSDDVITPDAVSRSSICNPHIECRKDFTFITGMVEEIQDGVMFLRMHDSLMMLYVSNEIDFTQYIGVYICVRISNIKLYDINP